MSTSNEDGRDALSRDFWLGIGAEPVRDGEVSPEDVIYMENEAARGGIVELGIMLALTVQDALAPALQPQKTGTSFESFVNACEHAKLGTRLTGEDEFGWALPAEVRRTVYLCPQHPGELICNVGDCYMGHWLDEHAGEFDIAKCFVCDTPMRDELTHAYREDFTPIVAEVVLRRPLNLGVADPFPGEFPAGRRPVLRMLNLAFHSGTLVTLPCGYLCPRHEDAAGKLPWQIEWPGGR
jgi:hypothetical protein